MDCKGGNPASALGEVGNDLWKNKNCSPHLEVAFKPCLANCIKKREKQRVPLNNNFLPSCLPEQHTWITIYKGFSFSYYIVWFLSGLKMLVFPRLFRDYTHLPEKWFKPGGTLQQGGQRSNWRRSKLDLKTHTALPAALLYTLYITLEKQNGKRH